MHAQGWSVAAPKHDVGICLLTVIILGNHSSRLHWLLLKYLLLPMFYLGNLGTEQDCFDFTPRIRSLKMISFWQLTFKR